MYGTNMSMDSFLDFCLNMKGYIKLSINVYAL